MNLSVKRFTNLAANRRLVMQGFRYEVSPKSKLGKLIQATAIKIRNGSNASSENIAQKTVDVWMGASTGYIYGKFTVRPKTQTISFKGGTTCGVMIEYVYGKLTIEHDGVYLPPIMAVREFSKFIHRAFPDLNSNIALELKIERGN